MNTCNTVFFTLQKHRRDRQENMQHKRNTTAI